MKTLIIFSLILSAVNTGSINSLSDEVVPNGRMKRGQNATVDHLKYQVLITVDTEGYQLNCGGSIISNEWVLTVALCFTDIKTAYVYLGMTVLSHWEKNYEITPGDIILHPDWHTTLPINNNIALIKIPWIEFSAKIQPVKLPSLNDKNTKYGRQKIVTTSWGVRGSDKFARRLQFDKSKVISRAKCQRWYGTKIQSTHICVSNLNFEAACSSYFGDPLILSSSNVQIGIYSFGSKVRCQKGHPDVYTRIASYLEWINNMTNSS